MRKVLHALVRELGEAEGRKVFEWYCKTYRVTIEDDAPTAVLHEVFGL